MELESREKRDHTRRHCLGRFRQTVCFGKIRVGELVEATRRLGEYPLVHQPAEGDARYALGVELARTDNALLVGKGKRAALMRMNGHAPCYNF